MEEKKTPKYTIETVWGRVMLLTYNAMPRVAEAIEKSIKRKALSSSKKAGDTERLASELISLIARKDALVFARKITNEALERMSGYYAYVLVEKYVKERRLMDLARELKLSPTEMFRSYLKALSAFSSELRKEGYYDYWFENKFRDEQFVMKTRERLVAALS